MSTTPAPINVTITGSAGQIGYALLFRIASGALFGPNQPVVLRLLEIPAGLNALKGVVMELEDCAFPLLRGIVPTTDPAEAFKNANWAFLVGSVPRKEGMERKDLLTINGKIFVGQGQAIAQNAAPDIRVLVVGNPCNTNCLIAAASAKGVPSGRFFAMTRLDENRAKMQLSIKSGVGVDKITRLAIWGNHSSTMVPDFYNARIDGKEVQKLLSEQGNGAAGPINNFPSQREGAGGGSLSDINETYLKGEFFTTIQQRGSAIIKARGLSSAASAANAAIDTVRDLHFPTPNGDFHSVGVLSDGSYGVPEGIVSSFPVRTDGQKWEIVQGLTIDPFIKARIDLSAKELLEERECVKDLMAP